MKDTSLITNYNQVLSDLKKVEEWRSSNLTREMASQMVQFVHARLELMTIYEQIANLGAEKVQNEVSSLENPKSLESCLMPIDEILAPKISILVRKYRNCLNSVFLAPLKDLFRWEIDSLSGLFSGLHHLLHYRFQFTLSELDRNKLALVSWRKSLINHKETRSSGWFRFRGPTTTSPTPSVNSAASPPVAMVRKSV